MFFAYLRPDNDKQQGGRSLSDMKKAMILLGVLLIPVFLIILNNKGRGDLEKDNITFKKRLSDYGLFKGKMADLVPNEQGIVYDLASTLFTDYSDKQRIIFLPIGTKILASNDGLPEFPDGTIITKSFFYPQKEEDHGLKRMLLETRLLINKKGQWNAATYQWNPNQDEAYLLTDSATVPVSFIDSKGAERQTNYIIPSRADCAACHRQVNRMLPIGPKIRNLNKKISYGKDTIPQLEYFRKRAVLDMASLIQINVLPDYEDQTESLSKRGRAYLEMNCAHCHNPKGTAYMTMLDLRFEIPLSETGIWLKQAKIMGRMGMQGEMHMPQKGTTVLHDEGLALIKNYLLTLK